MPPIVGLGTSVRFFAVDTVNLDATQMAWLDRELSGSKADWKIVYHASSALQLGPLRVFLGAAAANARADVRSSIRRDVVFCGPRTSLRANAPQNGVMYFVNGAAGSVRIGRSSRLRRFQAKGYDRDLSFMLVEIAGNTLYFQAINRVGETVDSGKIVKKKSSTS